MNVKQNKKSPQNNGKIRQMDLIKIPTKLKIDKQEYVMYGYK
jgi:hypothetical protein